MATPQDKRMKQLEDRVRDLERTVANFPARWAPQSDPGVWRDVQMNGSVSESDNTWRYGFFEVYLDDDETWQPVPNGVSGSADGTDYARNAAEANNSNTGVQGTGIDVSNLIGTFAHQPIADGRVVPMRYRIKPDGSKRAMIYPGNSIDGDCP